MTGSGPRFPESARLFDELLVTMMQAGDRRSADRLAARWHPRLARTARRLLGSEEMALVAVQESWVAILRGIGSLRDPARFAPWAFGILRRRCVDRIRASQSRRDREDALETDPAGESHADEGIAIRQAFAGLPHDQRLAAQLFFVEGLSLAEIAEVQQVHLGTAKTRLFHARRRLKAALADNPEGDAT
ncbi:MAG: RNA polymerase sigma factor [Erythrobacter sp.]